jgi:hypothetical protein
MDESFLGGSTGAVGALASETKESILDEELEKLNDLKFQLKDENAAYLTRHHEFTELLDEFVGEILKTKPKVMRHLKAYAKSDLMVISISDHGMQSTQCNMYCVILHTFIIIIIIIIIMSYRI